MVCCCVGVRYWSRAKCTDFVPQLMRICAVFNGDENANCTFAPCSTGSVLKCRRQRAENGEYVGHEFALVVECRSAGLIKDAAGGVSEGRKDLRRHLAHCLDEAFERSRIVLMDWLLWRRLIVGCGLLAASRSSCGGDGAARIYRVRHCRSSSVGCCCFRSAWSSIVCCWLLRHCC